MTESARFAFVSYSGDRDTLADVVTAMRRFGMRPWRDVEDLPLGARTREQILRELGYCRSALIWLTETSLASDYVTRIELPAIFELQEKGEVDVVPIFVSWEPGREASDAFRSATGREVGDFNGYIWDPSLPTLASSFELADRYAAATLADLAKGDGRPVVRCVTRSDAAPNRDASDVNLDWRREYPADGTLPDTSTRDALQASLARVSNHVINAFGPGTVDLSLRCHLHLAMAIGHAFRRPSGMIPTMVIDGDTWQAEMVASGTLPKMSRIDRADGPVGASRACLEISISRDVGPGVGIDVGNRGTPFLARAALVPPAGPGQTALPDATTANAWAHQAAQLIADLRSRPGVTDIDLFLAAPIQFAVLLGWQLNVGGPVHVHHWIGNQGPYEHAWTLPHT